MKINDIHNRYVLPTIEERTAYGYKRLDPYTKLFEERIIFLGQGIDDTVANDVMAQLLTLESMDPDRDIMMYINSPGGSFTALTAIYDTMQFVRPDVMTICLGQAASAAAVLLAGGTAGKRYALEHSRILIHQPYSEGGGQGSDIEIQAERFCVCANFSKRCFPSTPRSRKRRLEKILSATRFLPQRKLLSMALSTRSLPHVKLQPRNS
jgi:ATP-dependent Clp protease protease subunit